MIEEIKKFTDNIKLILDSSNDERN